ncbi:pertactin-like passenger domain-containing protein [Phocoenobacter uteri]
MNSGKINLTFAPVENADKDSDTLFLTGGANANNLNVNKGTVILQGSPTPHAYDVDYKPVVYNNKTYTEKREVVYDDDYQNPAFKFANIAVKNGAKFAIGRNVANLTADITLEQNATANLGYTKNDKSFIENRYYGGSRDNTSTFTPQGFNAMPQTEIRGNLTVTDTAKVKFGSKANYQGAVTGAGNIELDHGSQVTLASGSNFTGSIKENEKPDLTVSASLYFGDDAKTSPFFEWERLRTNQPNNSTVTLNNSHLTLQDDAHWTLKEDTKVGELTLKDKGRITLNNNFDRSTTDHYRTLTTERFIGEGGQIDFLTDLSSQQGDKVLVNKNATGHTKFNVRDQGREPLNQNLTLFEVKGENTLTATLNTEGYVDLGAYRYHLNKNDKNYVLSATKQENNTKIDKDKSKKYKTNWHKAGVFAKTVNNFSDLPKDAQAKRDIEAQKQAKHKKAKANWKKAISKEIAVNKAKDILLDLPKDAQAKRDAEAQKQAKHEKAKANWQRVISKEIAVNKAKDILLDLPKDAQAKRDADAQKQAKYEKAKANWQKAISKGIAVDKAKETLLGLFKDTQAKRKAKETIVTSKPAKPSTHKNESKQQSATTSKTDVVKPPKKDVVETPKTPTVKVSQKDQISKYTNAGISSMQSGLNALLIADNNDVWNMPLYASAGHSSHFTKHKSEDYRDFSNDVANQHLTALYNSDGLTLGGQLNVNVAKSTFDDHIKGSNTHTRATLFAQKEFDSGLRVGANAGVTFAKNSIDGTTNTAVIPKVGMTVGQHFDVGNNWFVDLSGAGHYHQLPAQSMTYKGAKISNEHTGLFGYNVKSAMGYGIKQPQMDLNGSIFAEYAGFANSPKIYVNKEQNPTAFSSDFAPQARFGLNGNVKFGAMNLSLTGGISTGSSIGVSPFAGVDFGYKW